MIQLVVGNDRCCRLLFMSRNSSILIVIVLFAIANIVVFDINNNASSQHLQTCVVTAFTTLSSIQQQQQQQLQLQQQRIPNSMILSHHPQLLQRISKHLGRQQHLYSGAALFKLNSNKNDDTDNSNKLLYDEICDVLVIGSGPAGRAIASLLSATSTQNDENNKDTFNVLLADQNLDRPFPPNYGVWYDEWEMIVQRFYDLGVTISGGTANIPGVDRMWNTTDCYFGGSFDIPMTERLRIDRSYYRVDKDALRTSVLPTESNPYREIKASHYSTAIASNIYTPSNTIVHDNEGTTIQLVEEDGTTISVRTKLIIDCTGHETKLVLRESTTRETSTPPGFQIAYGCLVDVECDNDSIDPTRIGPYDKEAMTLFDYRTDHYDVDDTDSATSIQQQQKVEKSPTFMYVMPIKGNTVFFEETSLVARPAISFQECKDRTMQRLSHHGIRITKLYEEEFCYIPMGGALPARNQRIIGIGGSAAMVHPATGYHICRCFMGAADVANVIRRELQSPTMNGVGVNLDRISALAYDALWSPSNIQQRNFAVFGGEYLMKQNVVGLRGFFNGFFKLPLPLWAGFLAGWPGLPNNENHENWIARLWFGVNFLVRLPPSVALDMTFDIITYIATTNLALAQSVTPFLGEPNSYLYQPNNDNVGDVAAKNEARQMILASKVVEDVPVDFEANTTPVTEKRPEAVLQGTRR